MMREDRGAAADVMGEDHSAERINDATRREDAPALRALLDGASPFLLELALLVSAEVGWVEGLEVAAAAGGDAACASHASGNRCAHTAARLGHVAYLEALRVLDPGLAGARNAAGQTPLHYACVAAEAGAAAKLLAWGADADAAAGGGLTPLALACKAGASECAALLLAAGAAPVDEALAADDATRAALREASRRRRAAAAEDADRAAAELLAAEDAAPAVAAPAPAQKRKKKKPRENKRPPAAPPAVLVPLPYGPSAAPPPAPDDETGAPWNVVAAKGHRIHLCREGRLRKEQAAEAAPPPPEPAAAAAPPAPREAQALLEALYPSAGSLALSPSDLLLPSEDLSASQLEMLHDILDSCTRRVIDCRIAFAARQRAS